MNILEARRRTLGKGVYKKTVEGNPAIAQGSLARRYPGIAMQGWTEQDSTTGAQLLNLTENTVTNSGITCVSEGSIITISGERVVDSGGRLTYVTSAFTLQPGTYRFSYEKFNDVNSSILNATLVKQVDNEVLDNAFTLAEETNLYIGVNIVRGKTADNAIIRCMLNAGSTALPYEPYTGGQSSPNPDYPQEITSAGKYDEGAGKYQYEVKLTGKNLLDIPDIDANVGIINFPCMFTAPIMISAREFATTSSPIWRFRASYLDGTFEYVVDNRINARALGATPENPIINIQVRGTYITDGAYRDIQVEYGDTPTDYEPYRTPQTVLLTSDRPLTKWDKLEKRNGQWGWVYKSNMLSVPKAGYTATGSLVKDRKYFRAENLVPDSKISSKPQEGSQYCNICNLGNPYQYEGNLFWIYRPTENKNGELRIGLSDTSIDTKELFEQYISDKDIYIWYETAEETLVPLSESEQEALNALHTFRPTTVLSNDCDCNMTLTYKTKKSLEATT